MRSSDEERRAAIDAEWSSKLQTIVNHLASDHEADVGQAMLEREGARAEARMLSSRLATLQATLESEREAQGKSNTAWMAERAQLIATIDSLRRRLGTSSGTIPLPAPPEGARPSVVVVHRDPAMRAIVKHALESCGYDVTTAADGLEAFRMAMSWRPSVVLAEVQMAKMDGRELVQMLKSRPETATVKIVLMSSTENSERPTGDYQADGFLQDPANVETLKATLANVLGVRA
jgi:CheY-like chemotaxis protein